MKYFTILAVMGKAKTFNNMRNLLGMTGAAPKGIIKNHWDPAPYRSEKEET